MLIFIDTNIFYNHWHLKNVDFTFLFNFIKNTESRLMMSEVVVLEIENNRRKELQTQKSSLDKALKVINTICASPLLIDYKNITEGYHFKKVLGAKLDIDFIDYIDVSGVSQEDTLKRAIDNRPPFKVGEKGYRDTLIWLSLLDFLKKNDISEEVAFINANSDDFYNGPKTDLKNELIEDMLSFKLSCPIKIYNSLSLFIEKNILDNDLLEEYELDDVESEIEVQTIAFLNNWTTEQLRNSLNERFPTLAGLLTIKDHEFEILEGMEDARIVKAKREKGAKVYVSYEYNFRIVEMRIKLSKEEFKSKYDSLSKSGNHEEFEDGTMQIERYPRIFFKSSFEYDAHSKTIHGLVVNEIRYKI